ncbi:MAG: universal stress protein [Candidatus Thiodiazotropha sp.]
MDFPKLLLMPLGDGGDDAERLSAALLVAKALNAHLQVMHTVLEPRSLLPKKMALPMGMLSDLDQAVTRHADRNSERLLTLFKQLCTERDVAFTDSVATGEGGSASWFGVRGVRSALVAQYGKLADWIVLSRPPGGQATSSFEAALSETGRPVLIVPRRMESFALDTVVVAWNCSREAVRAVAVALPVLQRAKRVLLLTCRANMRCEPQLDDLAGYLALHDVAAETRIIDSGSGNTGAVLNDAVKEESASMVVMGAYSSHRVRDLMFGDVTQYLLSSGKVPMLMTR